MLVGNLLVRGMLVGVLAAILSFAFLKVVGEPAVDRAIAFEAQMDESKADAKRDEAKAKGLQAPVDEHEAELVSRPVQAGIGLLTGLTVYNVAFGGLFALAYALAYGRMGPFGPRATSAYLALSGFVAVNLVPGLKYPANPPSIGDAETIGMRTGLYFAMTAFSLAAMVVVWLLRNRLARRFGAWDAALIALGVYLVLMVVASVALPAVNEVPEGFPAQALWQFRTASLGAQAIMWATIGLAFGILTERAQATRASAGFRTA